MRRLLSLATVALAGVASFAHGQTTAPTLDEAKRRLEEKTASRLAERLEREALQQEIARLARELGLGVEVGSADARRFTSLAQIYGSIPATAKPAASGWDDIQREQFAWWREKELDGSRVRFSMRLSRVSRTAVRYPDGVRWKISRSLIREEELQSGRVAIRLRAQATLPALVVDETEARAWEKREGSAHYWIDGRVGEVAATHGIAAGILSPPPGTRSEPVWGLTLGITNAREAAPEAVEPARVDDPVEVLRSRRDELAQALQAKLASTRPAADAPEPIAPPNRNVAVREARNLLSTTPLPSVKLGDASVVLRRAVIDYVALQPAKADFDDDHLAWRSPRRLLVLEIEIENSTPSPIQYRTFRGDGRQLHSARLLTGAGEPCAIADFGDLTPIGAIGAAEIAPGATVTDVVVFVPPEEKRSLRLELPASSVGGRALDAKAVEFELSDGDE